MNNVSRIGCITIEMLSLCLIGSSVRKCYRCANRQLETEYLLLVNLAGKVHWIYANNKYLKTELKRPECQTNTRFSFSTYTRIFFSPTQEFGVASHQNPEWQNKVNNSVNPVCVLLSFHYICRLSKFQIRIFNNVPLKCPLKGGLPHPANISFVTDMVFHLFSNFPWIPEDLNSTNFRLSHLFYFDNR